MKRALSVTVLAVLTMMVGVPASIASTTVDLDEVAAELRGDPVYVDADAARELAGDEVEELRSVIGNASTPVYIAIFPASVADAAGGDPAEVARQLAEAVGRPGTFGVVVGDSFRAGSTVLPEGQAGELAGAAVESSDDTGAALIDFVERVGDRVSDAASTGVAVGEDNAAGASGGSSTGRDGDSNGWVLPVVLAGGAGLVGALVWRRRQRRQVEDAERARVEEADRQMLKAEISVLADDVVRLETVVQVHPDARSDFDAAVSRYRAAQAALDQSGAQVDLVRVSRVVAEARYSMDRVRAIVDGRQPPPPPEDLQRTGPHGEPAVTLDEQRQPAYVGYPGGFQGGWFGGTGGSLFGGMLLGSMLAGGFGGWGHGGTTIVNQNGGDGDSGDAGGGGDFGGGDFGGGDFGGGDFGGGDF